MAGTTAVFRSACTGPARLANDEGGLRYARGVHRSAGAVRRVAPGEIAATYAFGATARQCGPLRGGETFSKLGLSFDPDGADEFIAGLSEIRGAEGDKFRETRREFGGPVPATGAWQ